MKVTFLSQLGQFIFLSKLDNSLSTAFRKSLSNCFSSKSIDIPDFLGMKISPPTIAVAINKLYQKGVVKMTQLTVTIPEEYVLITKEEYNELQEKEKPIWWSMQDLINETGFEYKWLKDNILMNPRYIKELKHFVYYPEGGKWAFNREPMQKFLKDNFAEIFN